MKYLASLWSTTLVNLPSAERASMYMHVIATVVFLLSRGINFESGTF